MTLWKLAHREKTSQHFFTYLTKDIRIRSFFFQYPLNPVRHSFNNSQLGLNIFYRRDAEIFKDFEFAENCFQKNYFLHISASLRFKFLFFFVFRLFVIAFFAEFPAVKFDFKFFGEF